jgi:hypothetical protein
MKQRSMTLLAAAELYKRLGVPALWYTLVSSIGGSLITFLVSRFVDLDWLAVSRNYVVLAAPLGPRIFMLIIGIVMPLLYMENFVAAGITRGQFVRGMLAAAALLALSFTLFFALILPLVFRFPGGMSGFIPALSGCVQMLWAFLLGWIATVGFSFRRFVPAAASILTGSVLLSIAGGLWSGSGKWFFGTLPPLSEPAALIIITPLSAVIAAALLKVVPRVPVKC